MMPLKQSLYRFLRFTERYTKTDMVYLAQGGFWLSAGPMVTAILSLLLSVAFANLLPAEQFGMYRYVLAVVTILSVATLGGMHVAMVRAVAQDRSHTVLPALARRIEWGLLGGLGALVLALYYYQAGTSELALLLALAAPFIPFLESFTLYQSVLAGLREFRRAALYLILSQITATLAVFVVLFTTKNILLILLTYLGVWTLARGIAFLLVRHYLAPKHQEPDDLRYGYHLSFMSALDTIAAQADKMLIFHFLGAVQLAGYAIATAIPDQTKALLKNALTVSFPSFSVTEPAQVRTAIHRASLFLLIPLALIALIYVALAPLLFSFLFPQYAAFVIYSQLYALVFLLVPKALHRIFFESHGKTGELYGFQILSFSFKIALFCILIPPFGVLGAITALLLNEAAVYLYLEFRLRKTA